MKLFYVAQFLVIFKNLSINRDVFELNSYKVKNGRIDRAQRTIKINNFFLSMVNFMLVVHFKIIHHTDILFSLFSNFVK